MATQSVSLSEKLNGTLKSEGIEIKAPVTDAYADVLTVEALKFLAKLARQFEARIESPRFGRIQHARSPGDSVERAPQLLAKCATTRVQPRMNTDEHGWNW